VKQSNVKEAVDRADKRISVALPVRVTYYDSDSKPRLEMACTYDISAHGARLTGLRCVKEAGEIVTVERGRSKAFCRVVWIGESNSPLHGLVGVQCVEAGKTLWAVELREMDQVFDPVVRNPRPDSTSAKAGNRRRYRRFAAGGRVELLHTSSTQLKGGLKDVSEVGCLISIKNSIPPGTDLKLFLKVENYDLVFKGQVRHSATDGGLGIEFREIRKGDRAILQQLLHKMEQHNIEEQYEKHLVISAGSSL
jgi:hypothetical protein